MPRPPRLQAAGGIFHITIRGVRRHDIFLDDRDRELFLVLLEHLIRTRGWICHAYCLMPNHFHLVIETPNEDLSAGMHWLNFRYAQWFNERHGYEGHVFDRRFHSVLVESQLHLLELARYVVLNPVRAGFCAHPHEWHWSSYGVMVGAAARPSFLTVDWLLSQFGREPADARAVYTAFVTEGAAKARSP